MTINLDDVGEALLPRRYQEEIFSRAQERNVIAALDTGSGKTYISTLLIKWISTRDVGLGKVIVFLVPKVALVEQQGDFIARETSLRVSKCYGATAIDLADRRGWRREIQNHDVLVMTAQIFLNILTHSHWSMDKISLMVFDECHHTRKNHAYNGIMREYFQWPPETRPKVFGMTASPIWNPRDAVESLATLERNLDAKVIAVRDHLDELADHSPKPQEIIHAYPNPPDSYPTYPTPTLWQKLKLHELPPELGIPVSKMQTRYEVTYNSIGPYGAELFLYVDMKHRIDQFLYQAEEPDYALPFSVQPAHNLPTNPGSTLPMELEEVDDVLTMYKSMFEDETNPDVAPVDMDLMWLSPKVRLLADLIFEHYARNFQGIVFVEQRHVAACLSKMLPRIPQLKGYVKSAQLIGHGANTLSKVQGKGMALRSQQDVVKLFRDKEVNLLVATAVAEEGLDFPACDLVIRFDPIQHMVGYIQSRGRARHRSATFIVMVQKGHSTHVERYKAFSESEPQLRLVYQTREQQALIQVEEDEEGAFEDPADVAERERYVVPSTNAVLTYNTGIGLLNHLCSLIPRDRFTPSHLPQYSGEFEATLQLPSSLPLPPEHLIFVGPPRRSKKEAKRAVAFMAVKRLHALNVFDDYLLPVKATSGDHEDADGRLIEDVSWVPEKLDVMVRDPWSRGSTQFVHIVYLDGVPTAGLVTGTALPDAEVVSFGTHACIGEARKVQFDPEYGYIQRRVMEDFTRMGLWWCVTGRGIHLPLKCYLVPITPTFEIDWANMENAIKRPWGCYDWGQINEHHYGRLLLQRIKQHGHPLVLLNIRYDLTPLSKAPPGYRESHHPTIRDYYLAKYLTHGWDPETISYDGPCVEAMPFPRYPNGVYNRDGSSKTTGSPASTQSFLIPQNMCRWLAMSEDVYRTFQILPQLCHRITDIYRVRTARLELGLPPIQDDLLIEALTTPVACAGYSNQRLETLGDSVLKLATVVHLFSRFPHRHEGQLDILRRNSVSNRTLLARAIEIGLECYLTTEPRISRTWPFSLEETLDPANDGQNKQVRRHFPRKSLQECMEAILGAAFINGGITMALAAGTALGLSFGGTVPWIHRQNRKLPETPVSALFNDLQCIMGYRFRCGMLLVEAITHPSFRRPDGGSYQRLEFLGDALADLVVLSYLYRKFPKAAPGQLSWARSRAVCAPALALVAVKHLGLHRMMLVNNVELSMAISNHVPVLEQLSFEDIVHDGWKHDPPKALSDVLEGVLGAVLVDCNFDFEKASVVTENILRDLLEVLTPDLPRDPISSLMVWSQQAGCQKIHFSKSSSRPEMKRNDSISVIVHELAVVGPINATSLTLAKGLASERAQQVLEDPESPYALSKICNCAEEALKLKNLAQQEETKAKELEEDDGKLDDETQEGFAALAQRAVSEVLGSEPEDAPVFTMDDDDDDTNNVDLPVDDEPGPQVYHMGDSDTNVFHMPGSGAAPEPFCFTMDIDV
ncbi:hypothetical protein C8Q75DRAFT_579347 [Abortiporus biennis]|nr:hypothetical protein C8Q75DRAFT_579347 [Abortiporus biennis]